MKSTFVKSFAAAAVGAILALGVGQAQAAPTAVAGVMVGAPGETTFKFANITETFVSGVGQVLRGVGRVSQVQAGPVSMFGTDFCVSGSCELTFSFQGYRVTTLDTTSAQNRIVFDGGSVNFFLDQTIDSDIVAGTGFTDGTSWLTLSGRTTTATSGPNAGDVGTLFGQGTSFANSALINGTGLGELSVTGGAAGSYFGSGTIMNLTSSFQSSPDGYALPLLGTANLQLVARQVPPTTVPEPATVAMLGMGLLGLGLATRSRRRIR
jgi:hypothetical protein